MRCMVLGKTQLSSGSYNGHDYANRTLFVSWKDKTHPDTVGDTCDKFKVSDKVSDLSDIMPNDAVDISFDRYGRIVGIEKLNK